MVNAFDILCDHPWDQPQATRRRRSQTMRKPDKMPPASPASRHREKSGHVLDLWREMPDAPAFPRIGLFFRRNLFRISAISLLIALASFGASLLIFTKYAATAVLLVDPRSAKITQAGGVLSNIGADAIAIESIVQVTKAEGFLSALVDQLALINDPAFVAPGSPAERARQLAAEALGQKLNISRRGTTYVIDVSATTPSADDSARIANAAAQKLMADQIGLRSGATERMAKEIDGKLMELSGRVARAEQAFAELKAKLEVTDVGQGQTLLERRAFELNQQLVLAGSRTAETRARYEELRKAGASVGLNVPQTLQSPVLTGLRAEYARLTRQAADQATVLGPRHPDVASLQAQVGDIRLQIGAEISRMMASARSDYVEAKEREATLSAQLKATQREGGRLGPELVKLQQLEREARAERSVYEELLNRQRQLAEIKGLEPSDIHFVSHASPPLRPSPGKVQLAIGSLALGLIAGLVYALTREWRRSSVRTSAQAERATGLAVEAIVPRVVSPMGRPEAAADLSFWLADLATTLLPEERDASNVVLVSSAHRGEGRSRVATGLASSLGVGGERVLLIEADRAPGRERDRPRLGLLDVLWRGEDLESAFVKRRNAGYTLLPLGGRTVDAKVSMHAMIGGATMRAAMKVCREWFDVIVIDGPPALASTHARLLSQFADVTLLVVEWDKTDSAALTDAIDVLDPADAGLVLNKVDVAKLAQFDPESARRVATQTREFYEAA